MKEDQIVTLLKHCQDAYALGHYYKLSKEEAESLNEAGLIEGTEITDIFYDYLFYKYSNIYPENQFFYEVGKSDAGYGEEVDLSMCPAGSMEELKEHEFDKWKICDSYVVSAKLDGCSLILFYKDGYLEKASTRGDGLKGFDVTRHIVNLPTIPYRLADCNDTVIIRGELIISKENWPLCKAELEQRFGKSFANARNTIAGYLNSKQTNMVVAKYAEFLAYAVNNDHTEDQKFIDLQEYGFKVPIYWIYHWTEINEITLKETIKQIKEHYNYECDGVIATLVNTDLLPGYETNTLNPRCSRKYKVGMADEAKETTITNIRWQISKDAMLKPVVEIDPVILDGATVSNVTANNYSTVESLGLGIGARIKVKRAGMVIPFLEEVLVPAVEPAKPDLPYKISGVEAVYVGDDPEILKEIALQKLIFSTKALDIDQAAEGNLRKISDEYWEMVNSLPGSDYMNLLDLILTDEDTLVNIIGKNGKKLYKSLHERVKSITEPELFDALGTFGRGIGKTKLQKIYDVYGHLSPTYEELMALEGFSDITAKQILLYESEYKRIKEVLSNMEQVKLVEKQEVQVKSDKYKDYVVCFTGVRSDNLTRIINENGGHASDNWTKQVNLLIAKDPNSNSGKAKKAREKGIKIISLQEAEQIFVD